MRSFDMVELPEIPDVPGMIKREEGQYLFWLASQSYTGRGAVVEIGTWLGKSTLHLAAGLRANPHVQDLVCYDHYQWAGGANWATKSNANVGREAGEDFMPDFLKNVADYADIIDARRSKIRDIAFDPGEIEILVLDAPKRAADIAAVLTGISSHIIPGETIIAWQDFMHPVSFEIPAILAELTEFQSPVHVVRDGTMVGFRIDKVWTDADVTRAAIAFRNWSLKDGTDAWRNWKSIVPEPAWASFQSGLAMLLHDNGLVEEACDLLETIIDDKLCMARWQKWRKTSIPARYPALFAQDFLRRA